MMGLSFRRSIKLGKNVRINFSKSGPSLSFGPKGAKMNISKKGYRTTFTKNGIQYRKDHKWETEKAPKKPTVMERTVERIENMRDSGLERVKTPKIIWRWGIASALLLISGIFFIPMVVFAFFGGIITLLIMFFNKQFRGGLHINQAIIHWENHRTNDSYNSLMKGLKIYDCETGRKLLKMIEDEVS